MFSIRKKLATWFYRQTQARHTHSRLAELQQRLAVLDKDIQETKHLPVRAQRQMLQQRKILVAQIGNLKKNLV